MKLEIHKKPFYDYFHNILPFPIIFQRGFNNTLFI